MTKVASNIHEHKYLKAEIAEVILVQSKQQKVAEPNWWQNIAMIL